MEVGIMEGIDSAIRVGITLGAVVVVVVIVVVVVAAAVVTMSRG